MYHTRRIGKQYSLVLHTILNTWTFICIYALTFMFIIRCTVLRKICVLHRLVYNSRVVSKLKFPCLSIICSVISVYSTQERTFLNPHCCSAIMASVRHVICYLFIFFFNTSYYLLSCHIFYRLHENIILVTNSPPFLINSSLITSIRQKFCVASSVC